jgi:hypothetical protein
VRLDDDVGGWVCGTGEHPPGANLVVVQEALVGLVDGAGDHLAGAGGAGPRAAGVGQVDPFLLGLVKDVHVVGHLELHLAVRRDELDVVGGLSPQPGAAGHGGGGKRDGGRSWRRGHAEGEGRRSAEAAEGGGHGDDDRLAREKLSVECLKNCLAAMAREQLIMMVAGRRFIGCGKRTCGGR